MNGDVWEREHELRRLFAADLDRQQATLDVPPPYVVDDPDEPLINNPRFPSGHMVPRTKGDPVWPWRWRFWRRWTR